MEDKTTAIEKTSTPVSLFDFGSNLTKAWDFSTVLAKSQIIPETFRGNPASCLIALDMANRMRRNPLEVMQAMYIVHGKPSFSSTFLIALINSCGHYEPLRFNFKGEGDGRSCMAWTVDKRTGEKLEGPEISMQMAKKEGWIDKNGSKWKTMPEVMLRYRAASFFSRAYCPDLTGGFHSAEEARDVIDEVAKPEIRNDIEAELLAQKKASLATPPAKAPDSKPEQPLAPIDPEMLPFGDIETGDPHGFPLDNGPAAGDGKPANGYATELDKLRKQLTDLLTIDRTAEEAEDWIKSNLGGELKGLSKDELKAAIAKYKAEMGDR